MSLENLTDGERDALAALAKSLGENPETRLPFQALIKKAHPTTATPELDNAMAIREMKKSHDETRAELDAMRAQTAARETELTKWAEAVGAGHCTYDDIPQIREFMNTNGIVDPANAAALWKQTNHPAAPSNLHSNVYELPTDHIQKWKEGGIANLKRTTLSEAHQYMSDLRSGKAKIV